MQFTRLAVMASRYLYWSPRAAFHTKHLVQMLGSLLDPDRPGHASVAFLDRKKRVTSWRSGAEAIGDLKRYAAMLSEMISVLETRQEGADEFAMNRFTANLFRVVFDKNRLLSWAGDHLLNQGRDDEMGSLTLIRKIQHHPCPVLVDFTSDWSLVGKSLTWAPLCVVGNSLLNLEGRLPSWYTPPSLPPLDAAEAAQCLEEFLLKECERLFHRVRTGCHLGTAAVKLLHRDYQTPIFYYAEPAVLPDQPEDYLDRTCLGHVETLCRSTLGTEDPVGSDVQGSLLEGNVLLLRHNILGNQAVQVFYQALPWLPSGARDRWNEVEREVFFLCDKITFVEFSAAFRVYDIITDLEIPLKQMGLWGGTLDGTAKLARALRQSVAFEESRSGQKARAFDLVKQLRWCVSRLEAEMVRVTDGVMTQERRWRSAVQDTGIYFERVISSRAVAPLRDMSRNLTEQIASFRITGEVVRQARERAEQLRTTFSDVSRALDAMLDMEQQEERERYERTQRVLGYGLAALATLTAFPLVVGDMNWAELQEVIARWPGPFHWLGSAISAVHPYLVLASLSGALGVIGLLLFGTFWSSRQRRPHPQQQFLALGRRLNQMTRGVEEILPVVSRVRSKAFVSRVWAGKQEDQEVQQDRERLDREDRKALEVLLEVDDWLRRNEDAAGAPGMDSTTREILRFVILVELMDQRLNPFPLPLSLCYFRYASRRYVARSIVSDYEFEQVLNGYGYEDSEVEAIDKWVEKWGRLEARDLLKKLEELGVSARHLQPLEAPPAS